MTIKRKILIGLAGIAVAGVARSVMQGNKPGQVKEQLRSLANDLLCKGKDFFGLAKEKVESRM